jgi:hypothetical protein
MPDFLVIGVVWGVGLWFLWFSYYLLQAPKWFKRWIMEKKYRVLVLDAMITFLGHLIINQGSGTIVAGIGTFVLLFMCLAGSTVLILIQAIRDNVRKVMKWA